MKIQRPIFAFTIFSFFSWILLASTTARAQDAAQAGVGRVSLLNGDVAMMRGDSGDWIATAVNTPLVTGDAISTGDHSRAEVQLDFAHVLRLAEHTQVKLAN